MTLSWATWTWAPSSNHAPPVQRLLGVEPQRRVDALAGKGAGGIALRATMARSVCHAPHLVDAEVGHVLRRALRRGELSDAQAQTALAVLPDLIDHRYPHVPQLVRQAWALRETVTFYDGLYVALAAALDVPLLTADARLASAPGFACRIQLIRR